MCRRGWGVPPPPATHWTTSTKRSSTKETEKEIEDIERIGKEIERVLLRIGTSQEPLADKDLLALKRLGVVDQATLSATQAEAKRIATEATTAIKVRVAGLKGTPPKSGSLGQMKK